MAEMSSERQLLRFTRREFVFHLSALAAAPPMWFWQGKKVPARMASEVFAEADLRTLESIGEQIYPKDEFPGATELGVVGFLVNTLLNAHPEWTAVYRAGLQAVRASSRSMFSRPFEELEFGEQTQLLSSMEEGKLAGPDWSKVSSRDFFSMIRDHTLQGVYSHPRYGGNKGKSGWKMIGYDDWWAE